MVKIEIDGQELQVPQGAMIIEAADKAGIPIPRFCYHKKLSIAANCRMCLVDVDNVGKPLPACATPVSEGMKVRTKTKKAQDAQKAVMEFLLINHPLDCPICDQGGQCELQDIALEYGESYSRFTERKRVVEDKDLGPLIATEMTRCIHCTRCVRFGKEIAGVQELGATGRGEHTEIGTYVERSVNSELSGNVIDLCPVGALTSKPFRYSARAWELYRQPSISMHDGLGSHLYYHVYQSKVLRVSPREQEQLNEVWLSDRDRFSYEALNTSERLGAPEMKVNGTWQTVDWQTALVGAQTALNTIIQTQPEQLGVIASPHSTLEELYLLQKLFKGKNVRHLDHRLHQQDFSDRGSSSDDPGFEISLSELQSQEAIIVVGSLLQHEAPLIAHRIRQASLGGSKVCILNPISGSYTFEATAEYNEIDLVQSLAALAKELEVSLTALSDVVVSEAIQAIAAVIKEAKTVAFVVGQWVETHPHRSVIYALLDAIRAKYPMSLNTLSQGSNSHGAWIANMLPDSKGLNAKSMFELPRQGYFIYNSEPELDSVDPKQTMIALSQAKAVVVVTPFVTEAMRQYATVLLPSVPASETSGTLVNYFGDWQSFRAAVKPYQEARPAWKIFRVLGNLFEVEGFEFNSSEEVLAEVRAQHTKTQVGQCRTVVLNSLPALERKSDTFYRLAPQGLYDIDNVVRRSKSLQETAYQAMMNVVRVHPDSLVKLGIEEGHSVKVEQDGQLSQSMKIMSDVAVPEGVAVVASARKAVKTLGAGFCNIRIITNVA
ncbi:MAG: NADH-quinone oxidoreductase subunit NuoG [Gammaproteobacteria bacterium]